MWRRSASAARSSTSRRASRETTCCRASSRRPRPRRRWRSCASTRRSARGTRRRASSTRRRSPGSSRASSSGSTSRPRRRRPGRRRRPKRRHRRRRNKSAQASPQAARGLWNCSRTSRSEQINRPQCRPVGVGTCVPLCLQSAATGREGACRKGHRPALPRSARAWLRRSRMAQLAQASQTAPVPPQNLEAEESVLGAMMLSPGAIGAVSEALDAGDFYRESHAKIYRAALALYARGEPVDAITLVDELDERGELEDVGGKVRIHELAALVPATANAGHYAQIVREAATPRGLLAAGQQIAQLGWERPGDTQMLVDRAEQVVFDLSQSRVSTEFSHIEELLKESFERITALYEAGAEVTGTPSGFRDLDRLTSGFQPGNLIIVAARPSMGKSGLGLCIAANLAVRENRPVGIFTLEMSKSEVTQRLMCSEAKVESQRLRTGKLGTDDWPRLTAACDRLAKAPIHVEDTGSITMMEIPP